MATMLSLLFVGLILGFGTAAPAENDAALAAVTRSSNSFATEYFKALVQIKSGNLITSPISVNFVLAMLKFGASEQTLNQLSIALSSYDSDSLTASGYRRLIEELNNKKDIDLKVANNIFPSSRFSLKQGYLNVILNDLLSEIQQVNFERSAEAAATINNWAKEQTNNLIEEIVKPDAFNLDTMIVLVNAIYFKGQWANKFDPQLTEPRPFYVTKDVVKQVPTMYRKGYYIHGVVAGLNARFLEIPYKDNETSLVLITPRDIEGITALKNNIQSINIGDMLKSGYSSEVEVFLPKFKFATKIDLVPVLKKMGLTDMFSSLANFERMTDASVYVSDAIQKALIEVNEEGSEAAAVTAGTMTLKASYSPQFAVDRPSIFAVVNRGRSLFMGVLADPSQTV